MIQISFFDEELAKMEAQRQLVHEKSMRCYRCLMHISHRCRNEKDCPEGLYYEEYTGSIVRQCICATVEIFQDQYIHCPVLHSMSCEECMKTFGDGSNFIYDESQNYKNSPRWMNQ